MNLKNANARQEMNTFFPDPDVQRDINMDLRLLEKFKEKLSSVECYIQKQVKHHNQKHFTIVKSISRIGPIIGLTIVYDIGDMLRFESVQKFASYSRLVKCKAESACKSYGTQGNKIGNAHLKWEFSEAAAFYLRGN
ncbi:MAG: transposase [Lentisphaeria bacterium]